MFAMARGERLEALATRVPIMSRQPIPRCSRHWYPAVGYLIPYSVERISLQRSGYGGFAMTVARGLPIVVAGMAWCAG